MPVTIQISKEAILACDVRQVREILDSFVPNLIERNRNRVEIEIIGYGEDSRELYLINEVRSWFHIFFRQHSGLVPLDESASAMAHLLRHHVRNTSSSRWGGTTVSPEDLRELFALGLPVPKQLLRN